MTFTIKHNALAASTARQLGSQYSSMSRSVRSLSSGLRVQSAADDAAGMAIRELMRSDVAVLNQGIRNANDAISMIQTADGALQIIDEKLIRMKELAEQAATGTYNSVQRIIIDSEFQAMGAEINRIATSTDFNGIKLLDGSLSGIHNGAGLVSTGALKVHFGTGNDSAEDYYHISMGNATLRGLGLTGTESGQAAEMIGTWWEEAIIDYTNKTILFDIPYRLAGLDDNSPMGMPGLKGIDYYALPVGLKNITVTSNCSAPYCAHKPHVCLFTTSGQQLTGPKPDEKWLNNINPGNIWWNGKSSADVIAAGTAAGIFNPGTRYDGSGAIKLAGEQVTVGGSTITMITSQNEVRNPTPRDDEILTISEVTSDLAFFIGGHSGPLSQNCNHYRMKIEAEFTDTFLQRIEHKGTGADVDVGIISIKTQELAQKSLKRLDDAMVTKDNIRAHLGAMQNRLENTVTNLQNQRGNIQAAESRISDTDVATEMTQLVSNQILTQASVAMLAHANNLPRMALQLIGG